MECSFWEMILRKMTYRKLLIKNYKIPYITNIIILNYYLERLKHNIFILFTFKCPFIEIHIKLKDSSLN